MTATRRAGLDLISHSSGQTKELGTALGRKLIPGDLILLSGALGSGKTTFIQGVASGLEIDDVVTSPTYTLAAEYSGSSSGLPVSFYHVDLYRLSGDEDEIFSAGLDEFFEDPEAICAVEWPQRAQHLLPDHWLLVEMEPIAETKRRVRLIARGRRYDELISEIRAEAGRGRG